MRAVVVAALLLASCAGMRATSSDDSEVRAALGMMTRDELAVEMCRRGLDSDVEGGCEPYRPRLDAMRRRAVEEREAAREGQAKWDRVSDDLYRAFSPRPRPRRTSTQCRTDYFGNVTCESVGE